MTNTILVLAIALIDFAAIVAIIKVLGRINIKTKIIYILVSTLTIFAILQLVYFFSSLSMPNKEIVNSTRNFIVFSFLPINIFVIALPIAIHIRKFSEKEIKQESFKKVMIIILAVFIILTLIEYFYFKNVQLNILQMQNI